MWDRAVYYVTGDIEVPAGETLTIMPGTTVYFSADSLMTVPSAACHSISPVSALATH